MRGCSASVSFPRCRALIIIIVIIVTGCAFVDTTRRQRKDETGSKGWFNECGRVVIRDSRASGDVPTFSFFLSLPWRSFFKARREREEGRRDHCDFCYLLL